MPLPPASIHHPEPQTKPVHKNTSPPSKIPSPSPFHTKFKAGRGLWRSSGASPAPAESPQAGGPAPHPGGSWSSPSRPCNHQSSVSAVTSCPTALSTPSYPQTSLYNPRTSLYNPQTPQCLSIQALVLLHHCPPPTSSILWLSPNQYEATERTGSSTELGGCLT